jgi:integrase
VRPLPAARKKTARRSRERGLVTRRLADGRIAWYVRLSYHGRLCLFTPEVQTKEAARALYYKLKTEERLGILYPERYQRGHRQLVHSFIDRYLPTIHHKATAGEEARFAGWWNRWFHGADIRAVDSAALHAARAALKAGQWSRWDRPRSHATVNRYLQWLHQVLAHPVNRKYLPNGLNPLDDLEKLPESEPPPTLLLPHEEAPLFTILEQLHPGSSAWARLALTTGLRESELFRCPKDCVDLTRGVIVVRQPKHQRKPKYVIVPDAELPVLRELLSSPGPWLIAHPDDPEQPFPIKNWYRTVFRRAVREAGLSPTITWHTLRHTWATRLLEAGGDARQVQEAGGWSSLRMVERYAKVRDARLRDLVNRAASNCTSTALDATPTSPIPHGTA